MKRFLPWLISTILAIALAAMALYHRQALEQKQSEVETLKQQQIAATAEAAAKLKAANDRVAAAEAKTQEVTLQAASKVMEITTQAGAKIEALAAEARDRLQAANLPEATAAVTFRKALFSNGSVALVKNTSSSSSAFTLTVTRISTNQTRDFPLVIDAGKFAEVGEREGWAFAPGDTVRISQPSHKPQLVRLN